MRPFRTWLAMLKKSLVGHVLALRAFIGKRLATFAQTILRVGGLALALARRQRVLTIFVISALAVWLIPGAIGALDDPPYKPQHRCIGGPNDPIHIRRPGHVGKVLKIRLTDAGEFVDRCELTDVLYELNWGPRLHAQEHRPDYWPEAKKLPKFVVLYIHGWKHSAAKSDSDLVNFTALITQLASANADKKQVLGIYVGWNATSKIPPFNWAPFDNLTFWSKQTIADRIAQSAVVTKIVSSVGSIMSQGDPAANQFIVLGHSFGARILFSATHQPLISETARAHPGYAKGVYKRIDGIANAIILLNPAFEAARYTALASTTRVYEGFQPDQLPLLLSVSSDGDWATKTLFPLGQWLGFYRSETELITLGNYREFQTHSLSTANHACGATGANELSERFLANGLCLARDQPPHHPELVIQRHNPFLIARATSDIIKDHNDIWNDRFSSWLFAYINELGNKRRPRLLDKP